MQTISTTDLIKRKFIGADDLRRDLSEILDSLPSEDSELVITQHGKPKAILLDINTYLELTDIQEDVVQPGFIDSLYEELADVKKNGGISHEDLLKKFNL